MIDKNRAILSRFGFSFDTGSTHMARTYMLSELQTLLAYAAQPNTSPAEYRRVIVEENCLHKRSGQTRILTSRHLVALYTLDPAQSIFRTLRFFWSRDPEGQPLLALLCAYVRDALLRASAPFVLETAPAVVFPRTAMEEHLASMYPDRFSTATRTSIAQNLLSTWTQTGHLQGKLHKIRTRPVTTLGAVAYALYLGYLAGERGQMLFSSPYTTLLDAPVAELIDLADTAARRGWLVFKHIGDVIEVQFPHLLTTEEKEWLRE